MATTLRQGRIVRLIGIAIIVAALLPLGGVAAEAQILVSGHTICVGREQHVKWAETSCVYGKDMPNDSGNYVRSIQALLNRFGYFAHGLPWTVASCQSTYSAMVTGSFFVCTEGAVNNFQ